MSETKTMTAPIALTPLAAAILDLVTHRDFVSFAEIQRHLGEFSLKGHIALEIHPNVVLWTGMSEQFFDALELLRCSRLIHLEPAPLLVYLIGGAVLTLPSAKRIPKGGYKDLHWLPVVLRPGWYVDQPKSPTRST